MTISSPATHVNLLKIAYISGLASGNLTKACFFSKSPDIKRDIINSLAIGLLCTSGSLFAKFFTENKTSTSSEPTSLTVRKTCLSAFLLGSMSTIKRKSLEDQFFDCAEAVAVGFSIEKAGSDDMESLQSIAVNATIRRVVSLLFSEGISTFTNLALGVTSFSCLLKNILGQTQSKDDSKNTENSFEKKNRSLAGLKNQPVGVTLQSIPFLTPYTGEENLLNPNPDLTKKMYVIINQKKLNHIILCGEAGSGKTTLVRFFIKEILLGKYPKLQGSEVYKLDPSALESGSGVLGILPERIQKFEKYIQQRKDSGVDKIIVCIDEIHQLCGMGTHMHSSNDVWQFLKEKLADPFIIILGTTTPEEYTKHIAKDEALKSRLTKLDFPPPSEATKEEIINFEAKKCIKDYPSLKDLNECEIKEIIQRAKTKAREECSPLSQGSIKLNLRNILKCLWFEFSAEDLRRTEVK